MNEAYRELARQLSLQAQRGRELQTLSPLDDMTLQNAANALFDAADTLAQLTALQDAVKEWKEARAEATRVDSYVTSRLQLAEITLRALVDPSSQEQP